MKDRKKLVPILSVVVVVVVLLAAGILWLPQIEQPAAEPEPDPQEPVAERPEEPQEPEEPEEPTPPPLIDMEMFINHPWWWIREWGGTVPDEITRITGVNLNITVATDAEQLPMMVAAGDLPELIFTDNGGHMVLRLSDPDLTHPWNELIERYAPDFQIDELQKALYTQADGNFYTILNNFSTEREWQENRFALPSPGGLALREDILEQMGNPQIQTLDDLVNVFGMVKEQFPDLVPLVMNTHHLQGFFLNQFGLQGGGFAFDEQDRLVYYIREPGRLEFYKFFNSLYRNGFMIAENFAFRSEEESFQYAWDLRCFAYGKLVMEGADILNTDMERLGHDVRWKQITEPLKDTFTVYNTSAGWSGVFITRNNENPDRAIRFMEFLYSQQGQRLAMWGIEGKHWNMSPEGFPILSEEMGDPKFVEAEGIRWWGLLIGSAVVEALFNYNPAREQGTAAALVAREHMEFYPGLGLLGMRTPDDKRAILTRLDEMVRTEENKIILAESEAEAVEAYENMLRLADEIGAAALEEWANQEYTDIKRLFE